MFSYKFACNRHGSLIVRIVNNRRKAEITLPVSATQDEIDVALLSLAKRGGNTQLKSHLSFYISKINEVAEELVKTNKKYADVSFIKDMLLTEFGLIEDTSDSKPRFIKHYIKFAESKTNKGTRGVYMHTLSRMRDFDHKVDKKTFEDINLQWLMNFEAFCAQTANKNARNIHLRNIRAVFNNAIDFEITTAYPFRRFKIRPEATRKRALTLDALRALFDFPVEPYIEYYRDMFKLMFMLIGINTVDLYGLKSITYDGRIEYRRAKTHKLYSVKVEPEALELINKYKGLKGLLNVADRWSDSRNFRRQCNMALQRIGEVERRGLGGKKYLKPIFPELTTYWARHTWATIAASLDIPKDTIAQALGHGNNTVTDIYIDFDRDKIDEANRRVLDWVLYGKRLP